LFINTDQSDYRKIPENTLKVFKIGEEKNEFIFNYRMVIEKAQAYHGPDDWVSWFVELCKIKVSKKYLHVYPPLGRTDAEKFLNRVLSFGVDCVTLSHLFSYSILNGFVP
jgi:hypothetical protein